MNFCHQLWVLQYCIKKLFIFITKFLGTPLNSVPKVNASLVLTHFLPREAKKQPQTIHKEISMVVFQENFIYQGWNLNFI